MVWLAGFVLVLMAVSGAFGFELGSRQAGARRALVREMEDKLREQQGGGARSGRELALLRALDAMDDVVRKDGSAGTWDDVRPAVAAAFDEAGMDAIARIAAPL